DDVMPMFDRLFRGLPDDAKRARAPFSDAAVQEIFPWNATMATSLASFTKERLEARKKDLLTPSGVHSLGKDTRVLMSPDYVGHLMNSYGKIVDCNVAGGPPPNDPSFAPCLAGEFPAASASIKTRWMPGSLPTPTYDTSAEALTAKLKRGAF